MQTRNVVALIADRAYLPGAFATAASLIAEGLREDAAIVLLHPPAAINEVERAWIARRLPRLELVEPDARHFLPKELSSWDTRLAPLFLRFALPEIFPRADRILYVDSDVLALRSVNDAFEFDLRGRLVAAAHDDLVASLVGHKPSWIAYRTALGVPVGTPYLNCGVLLIDAPVWREKCTKSALIETYLSNRERCRYFDQSAINLLLKGDFAALSPAWNFQQNYQAIGAEDFIQPRLLHFAGTAKPWRNDGFVFRAVYRQRYREILAATPFGSFFTPYWRLSGKQAREAWRSLARTLRGREGQSGIKRADIPFLRRRLTEMMSSFDFIDETG